MKIIKTEEGSFPTFFDEANQKNKRVQMGIITLQPGEKSPQEGFPCHEQDEYSYVISGRAHTVLETGEDKLGLPGDAQWIEANEKHWNYNDGDEPAVVVWMLVSCGTKDTKNTDTAKKENQISLMAESELTSLDSSAMQDFPDAITHAAAFEGLYTLNDQDEAVPAVAKELPEISEDGKKYTIQ